MFSSIRSSIAAFTSVSIVLACTAVVLVSLSVYEKLYLDSVKKDLSGLSSNLANDLLPVMSEDEPDSFQLTMLLLRLDRYENVKFAGVLNADYDVIELYGGKSLRSRDDINKRLNRELIDTLSFDVDVIDGELIAFKRIGDFALPQGYLLIVNDASSPLQQSKSTLLYSVLPLASLIVIISILISAWQNYRLLAPLKYLTEIARKIKKTNDYSIQINIEGKREVKDLASEIGSMMKTIDEESTQNMLSTSRLQKQRQAMERMANYDSLTGLPSRAYFLVLVERSLKSVQQAGQNAYLIYCDLDGFKAVNDLHGHDVGDKLLQEVSRRLQIYGDKNDIVSRIGGDEFLVLLHGPNKTDAHVNSVVSKIITNLQEPYIIDGWEVNISASAGIASAIQSNYEVARIIAYADTAMYRAKLGGKNQFALFQESMMTENKRRVDIANAIPLAIKNNEFHLFYQAKVNKHQQVVGFEALIRWTSDSLGFISPLEFISIAEQSGRITLITHWVIEKTCSDLAKLLEAYGKNIVVSLNLSANDLKDSKLLMVISRAFKKYNINPKCIEFEVTESSFLENFDQANLFFDQVKNMGCSVALDDFGTGYSSLSYLTKINLNTVKIDKQFIDGIGESRRTTLVTKTIIEMAHNLNLLVCAEGVETEAQANFLIDLDCGQLQGYYYARPQPLDKVLKEVNKTNLSI